MVEVTEDGIAILRDTMVLVIKKCLSVLMFGFKMAQ